MGLKKLSLIFVLLATVLLKTVSSDLKLVILHNNDLLSHFEETSATSGVCQKSQHSKCYGGFARIAKTVKEIRENQNGKRDVLFLNAGNTFQGTYYYSIFKWQVVAAFIDLIGLDVMSLGNHEFDNGPESLANYLSNITTESVAANIDISKVPHLAQNSLKRYKIFNIKGTLVAVIGYITPDTKFSSNPEDVIFNDEISSIKIVIEELKNKGVKIFIALGNSGYGVDKKIAASVPDIDLVVGGHTNTFLYNGSPPDIEKPIGPYPTIVTQDGGTPYIKHVPVVQAYAFTKYLGYLEVDFDDNGNLVKWAGNPILLNNSYGEDEEVLNKLKPWKNSVNSYASQIIGNTKVFLDAHNHACALGECNIGNFIADSMIENYTAQYHGNGWSDASIAFIQGGAIRQSILGDNGTITYGDVLGVLPFRDGLVKGKLKGKYLKEAFEFAVHRYERTEEEVVGEFLQVSGVHVVYDISKPSGNRVETLHVRCGDCNVPRYSTIDEEKIYTIITTGYIVKGGDGFIMIRDNLLEAQSLGISDTEAVVNFIRNTSPIYPMIINRIVVKGVSTSSTLTPNAKTKKKTTKKPKTTTTTTTTTTEPSTFTETTETTEISTEPLTESTESITDTSEFSTDSTEASTQTSKPYTGRTTSSSSSTAKSQPTTTQKTIEPTATPTKKYPTTTTTTTTTAPPPPPPTVKPSTTQLPGAASIIYQHNYCNLISVIITFTVTYLFITQ